VKNDNFDQVKFDQVIVCRILNRQLICSAFFVVVDTRAMTDFIKTLKGKKVRTLSS